MSAAHPPATVRARRLLADRPEAPHLWGVPPDAVARLRDRNRPLAFHSLFDTLRTAVRTNATAPAKEELTASTAAAALIARALA